MDIAVLALTGAKYILKLITGSKTFDKAKEDALGNSYDWVKQHIFKARPALEAKLNQVAAPEEKQRLLAGELTDLLQDQTAREAFVQWLQSLQSQPAVRNYFGTEIDEIEGNIHVGNTGAGSTGGQENIAMGKIGKMKGDFHVGDR